MKTGRTLSIALGAVLLTHTAANAALVGVTLDPFPDLFSSFLDVTYDESIDELLVSGFPTTYTPDNMTGPQNVLGPNQSFTIDLTVDNAGVASGGSLSVMGNVLSSGPDLLQADLLDFGFIDPPGGEIFDFLFVVSGGDLAADFGGIGATIGVILDINDPGAFDGTFDSDFATTGAAGVSDTGVPEPTSIFLLGVAAGALFLRRRARV